MTHLLIQPGSLARPQSAATAAIGLFVHHLDKTKEQILRSWYLGAGRLATVDKYYYLSHQKTIIIIIFPTRPTAWSPLSVHQAITPSIVPFYNSHLRVRTVGKGQEWMYHLFNTMISGFLLIQVLLFYVIVVAKVKFCLLKPTTIL